MAKQTYVIREFHGGVNSNADPRDITQEESPSVRAGITNLGKLTTQGEFDTGTVVAKADSSTYSSTAPTHKSGLFVMASDRQIDNSATEDTLIFFHDETNDSGYHIDVKDSDGWYLNEIEVAANAKPVFFAADGVLRIGNANEYTATDWYGYIGRTVFASLECANTFNDWFNVNASVTKPNTGKCLISTPFIADDAHDAVGGPNSSSGEYIGATGNSLVNTNSINLRVGLNTESSIKGTQDGLYASDVIIDTPGGNASTPYNYKNYVGGTDGSYTAAEDVFPFLFDNNILVGLKKGQATSIGNFSTLEASPTTIPNIDFTINEENSIAVPIYFWQEEYDRLVKVKISIGKKTIQSEELNIYAFEFGAEQLNVGWNVLVCEAGMHTAMVNEPPSYGTSFTYFSCTVKNNQPDSSGSPSESNSFPKWYISGPAIISRVGATGYGPGTYSFKYTWLYDEEKQESNLFKLGDVNSSTAPFELNQITIVGAAVLLNFDIYINPKQVSTYGLNQRITGARVYYKKTDDDSHYLIGESDFIDKGFKFFPEAESYDYSFVDYAHADDSEHPLLNHMAVSKEISPEAANLVDTYKSLNGFYSKIDTLDARWKTATIQGRRAYVGNVQQDSKNYPDRMLKSLVNKFDVFPNKDSVVDVAVRDGESIVKLESFADRILQFKQKTLYIINVAQGSEFLEDVHPFKGIANEFHSVETDNGIVFFNQFGAYVYNGNQIINLLEKNGRTVISEEVWSSFITQNGIQNSSVGYAPKKYQILFLNYTGEMYIYNIKIGAWTSTDGTFDLYRTFGDIRFITKMAIDGNNDSFFIGGTAGAVYKYNHSPSNTHDFLYQTKDIDFGDPSVRKKVYKIYITYKTSATELPNINCTFDTNGGTAYNKTFKAGTNYSEYLTGLAGAYYSLAPSADWTVAELKPTTSSQANNIYSFALKIAINSNIRSNTAQGADDTTHITLDSGASAVDDYYNNMPRSIWSGNGLGDTRIITDYVGSSKVATISAGWSTNPNSSSKFIVGVVPSSFEINDITIVYRAKSVK